MVKTCRFASFTSIRPQFKENRCKILCLATYCQLVCERSTLCSKLKLGYFRVSFQRHVEVTMKIPWWRGVCVCVWTVGALSGQRLIDERGPSFSDNVIVERHRVCGAFHAQVTQHGSLSMSLTKYHHVVVGRSHRGLQPPPFPRSPGWNSGVYLQYA